MGLGGTFSYFELGPEIEMESLLHDGHLPSYVEMARFVFYTATGEEFREAAINEATGYIGESREYKIYLHYRPDIDWLKANALTLDDVKKLPPYDQKKKTLVFAPSKYVDDETLRDRAVLFSQLPYEIYRIKE